MDAAKPASPGFAERVAIVESERLVTPGRANAGVWAGGGPATNSNRASVTQTAAIAYVAAMARPAALTPGGILALQRLVGNAAVNQVLRAKALRQDTRSFQAPASRYQSQLDPGGQHERSEAASGMPKAEVIGVPVQLFRIANLAAGTEPETLMKPQKSDDVVLNVDTGHMTLSDVLVRNRLVGQELSPSWQTLAIKFVTELNSIQYPKTTSDGNRVGWLMKNRLNTQDGAMALLKQYMKLHPNLDGARHIYDLLAPVDQKEIEARHKSLGKDFNLGDVRRIASTHENERYDAVHIINALGFDPLNDDFQVQHMAIAVKVKGELRITAESTGESLKALFSGYEAILTNEQALRDFLREHGQTRIGSLSIGKYFKLVNYVVDDKSTVLLENPYTADLKSRHTVASVASAPMAEKLSVLVVLERLADSQVASTDEKKQIDK